MMIWKRFQYLFKRWLTWTLETGSAFSWTVFQNFILASGILKTELSPSQVFPLSVKIAFVRAGNALDSAIFTQRKDVAKVRKKNQR